MDITGYLLSIIAIIIIHGRQTDSQNVFKSSTYRSQDKTLNMLKQIIRYKTKMKNEILFNVKEEMKKMIHGELTEFYERRPKREVPNDEKQMQLHEIMERLTHMEEQYKRLEEQIAENTKTIIKSNKDNDNKNEMVLSNIFKLIENNNRVRNVIRHEVESFSRILDPLEEDIKKTKECIDCKKFLNLENKVTSLQGEIDIITSLNLSTFHGPKGDKGDIGAVGPRGLQGPKGELGIAGIPGEKGAKGNKGAAGQPGLPGLNGEKGDKGEHGLRGLKGELGEKGSPGLPGAAEQPGLPGLNGEKGDKGEHCLRGLKGELGEKGSPGLPGLAGLPGIPGMKGSRGLPGPEGSQGIKGNPGIKGSAGSPGLKGAKGERGYTGSTGSKGQKGKRGIVPTRVRLVGGTPTQGRVEIMHNGIWGTVCDDNWGNSDARVVCRMLGLSGGTAYSSAYFGHGSGTIWLDDVDCNGSEYDLGACSHRGYGSHNCGHGEDAGVSCT